MRNATIVRRRTSKRRRGAAVVEFALVAPVFILLVFGILEYGRVVMVQQVLANAAREGVRVGVLDGATGTSVATTVNDYLHGAGLPNATVTVDPTDPGSAAIGDPVTVTAQLTFGQVTWLRSPIYIDPNQALQASAVMRYEGAQ
jgi:Flp pilus assembly protein TadG